MYIQMEKEWDYKNLLVVVALNATTTFFCYT